MASYRKQNKNFGLDFDSVQLGVEAAPAQIVAFGFPSDVGKRTTSCQMVLKDPASIEALHQIEQELEQKASPDGFVLNSCIVRTTTVGDVTYPVIRCKFSKDPNSFQTVDAWTTGAAVNLDNLHLGHTVVTMVNPSVWCRNKECGVTLYVNQSKCLGKEDEPIGQRERDAVVWK